MRNAMAPGWSFFFTSIATIFLYAVIIPGGDGYSVTVGGICCLLTIILSFQKIQMKYQAYAIAFFLVFPCLVMYYANTFDQGIAPSPDRFLKSYALWSVSVFVIGIAFLTESPVLVRRPALIAGLILGVAAIQSIGAQFFHNDLGYRLVAPFQGNDILGKSYLNLKQIEYARAIGTYYEPSMCGRVIVTLAFIDYIANRKALRLSIIIMLGLYFTRSIGLLIFSAALGVILIPRSPRGIIAFALASIIMGLVAFGVLGDRLTSEDEIVNGSSYIRTVAPYNAISTAIAEYPMGIPIGAAEILAKNSGYTALTGEAKITNGIYEFVGYFGILGVAILAVSIVSIIMLTANGQKEAASALTYVVMSTAISGSFLAIESSLLTYFFVVAARARRGLANGT